jgi:acyl-CoA thioesterase I
MLLATLTFALVCAAAAPVGARDRADRSRSPRIVVLGDSLSSGHGIGTARSFPALLQQRLDAHGYRYHMVNAGVSGDTTAGALRRVGSALQGDVEVLVIALGANDGLRGVPVAEVKANLTRLIEDARRRNIAVLLCAMEALPLYGWDYTVAFHRAYRELGDKYDIPLVPFFMLDVLANPELVQPDRIHPNESGARAIADVVWPYLRDLLQAVSVESPA